MLDVRDDPELNNKKKNINVLMYNILDLAVKTSKPFLLIGPKGTGKTSYIRNRIYQQIDKEKEEAMVLNLTPKITQRMVYYSIIGKMNKIRRGLYGPNGEKKSIIFIDNIGLPLADDHGNQPALEIIHQMLDQKFMYEPSTFQKVQLQNTTVVSCLTTSFGMNQPLSARGRTWSSPPPSSRTSSILLDAPLSKPGADAKIFETKHPTHQSHPLHPMFLLSI